MRRPQLEIEGVRWWLRPDASPERLAPLLARLPQALACEAEPLKRGRRKELYRWSAPAPAGELLVKVSRYERGAGLVRRWRASKARRELATASALAAEDIEAPVPLAAGEERRAGRLRACYLLLPRLAGAAELAALWREGDLAARERRELSRALGTLARRLHRAALVQPDFAPNNFLVQRGSPPHLLPIDFERARRAWRLTRASRARMLATLDAHLGETSAATRWRFTLAYAGGSRQAARAWWERVARAAPGVAAAEWAHLRHTVARDGRQFGALALGPWRGWARRGAPALAALERANAALAPLVPGAPGGVARGSAELLCWRGYDPGRRGARDRLALAELLWTRGRLAPEPLALLRAGGEARLWWRVEPGGRRLCELGGPEAEGARRAAAVLLARLLGLGRLRPPGIGAEGLLLVPRPGRRFAAQLLDLAAFRPGAPQAGPTGLRARELLARL